MNRQFQAHIHRLGQPIAVGGMLLLAVNDLVFQRFMPGWLTGKLSDFAWFLFAPCLLGALLALLPRKWMSESLAGALAYGLLFFGFTLVKVVPAVNQAVISLGFHAGMPIKLALDPGDVLAALAGCIVSWTAWKKPLLKMQLPKKVSLALLAASSVLIAADMAAPNLGIRCVEAGDAFLKAADLYSVFVSSDGGLSWQGSQLTLPQCNRWDQDRLPHFVTGEEALRYTAGESVERSSDGGETWQVIFRFQPMEEVDQQYYRLLSTSYNSSITLTPLDAIKDSQTGNVVFAMGHEGVLVYTAAGEWLWVRVGQYAFDRSLSGGRIATLLMFPLLIALLLAGLAFGVFSLFLHARWWKWLLLLPAASVGGLISFSPPGTIQDGYSLGMYAFIGDAILTGLLFTFAVIEAAEHFKGAARRMTLYALLAGLVYLVGPVLWVLRVLPKYSLAALLGIALAVFVLVVGAVRVRRKAIQRVLEGGGIPSSPQST